MDEKILQRLAERSRSKQVFTYTDFLDEADLAIAMRQDASATAWGGTEFATRKIVRYGSDDVCYDEAFPLKIIKIRALGGKFTTPITHRDVLGAIMNLGIERSKVGDIFADETSYVVAYDTIADYVVQSLNKVGKNFVETSFVDEVPNNFAPQTTEKNFTADSCRLDTVIARVFCMSREKASQLIERELVKIDGRTITKSSVMLKQSQTVSVRGARKVYF